jgi:hypothetical protein
MTEANFLTSRAVLAPLQVEQGPDRLGRALWLYLWLVSRANHAGRVCRTVEVIARELAIAEGKAYDWITRLSEAELIQVQGSAQYLAIRLRVWPGKEAENPANGSKTARSQEEVPVGSGSKLQQPAASSKLEDGGVGEGESLFERVAEVIGKREAEQLSKFIGEFPREVVERAILRVKTTPRRAIRKSRAALLRFLLNTFNDEAHGRS